MELWHTSWLGLKRFPSELTAFDLGPVLHFRSLRSTGHRGTTSCGPSTLGWLADRIHSHDRLHAQCRAGRAGQCASSSDGCSNRLRHSIQHRWRRSRSAITTCGAGWSTPSLAPCESNQPTGASNNHHCRARLHRRSPKIHCVAALRRTQRPVTAVITWIRGIPPHPRVNGR